VQAHQTALAHASAKQRAGYAERADAYACIYVHVCTRVRASFPCVRVLACVSSPVSLCAMSVRCCITLVQTVMRLQIAMILQAQRIWGEAPTKGPALG